MSFGFYLATSESGANLAVEQSLVHGRCPKMFLLFFRLALIQS